MSESKKPIVTLNRAVQVGMVVRDSDLFLTTTAPAG